MESFLIYIFKASALLGIFYLSYLLLLKRETSFELNRKFLLSGLFTSLILPLISLKKKVYIEAAPETFNYIPTSTNITEIPVENTLDWWYISGIIYLIITGFFLTRFCIQVSAVIKIILINKVQKRSAFKYLEVTDDQLPFSFFNYIVFNPYKHSEKDLRLILEHEKVHARQLHSADIILVNLINCVFWFNPFSWFYKKAVEQNLEFIADRETVSRTEEIKEYQHALVKVSIADLRPALTNHFYQSFIKKRILMLNKKSSSQSPAWKLSLIMPIILAFMLLFNVKTEAQVVEKDIYRNTDKQEAPQPQHETEVVEDIEITEAPGEIEIETEDAPEITWTAKTITSTRKSKKDLGRDPLYVLNGKRYKASKLKTKYISLGSEFEILTGKDATNTFGEDAEGGAIIIPDAEIIKNFDKVMEEIGGNNQFSGRYIMVDESGKPNYVRLNASTSAPNHQKVIFGKGYSTVRISPKMSDYEIMHGGIAKGINRRGAYGFRTKNRNVSGNNVSIRKINKDSNKVYVQTQNAEPIYVVDEEIRTKDFIQLIQPEDIASINVLKGEKATAKYGKKGTEGVIEIYTKKDSGELSDSVFLISKSFTNAEIENLKKEVLKKTGYTLEVKDIERNGKGQIANIAVKFFNSNSMVQSSYSNENGIPNIHVGLKKGGGLIISASE
ncbi:TonB-dependent receptor-like protein [Christiangramia gaetbulicola]|uniref:TonB-dependent receptor-like protein n=1 Tax=Christiangramia gaetbulicola TaxID=703340 RepID=A0A2T6AK19_9FLAO|nr:M56 family metallopeptidase [Christiangramia gaetbulicola]PTX44162.1 TonB-dependent receptor-like protein [Christiangramia gaetbulicola]